MTEPAVTVGVVAGIGPQQLERTMGAVLEQLADGDSLLVALLRGISAPEEAGLRVAEARSAYRAVIVVDLVEGMAPEDPMLAISPAAARNAILARARGDVVAYLDDGGLPLAGWLESIRASFIDSGVDAVAGAFEAPTIGPEPGARPGGRLRWTGHLVTDYSASVSAPTSLASGRNCAVRRRLALELGGFDEAFEMEWPYEDVEFFTRLAKVGGRTFFVPGALIRLMPVSKPRGPGEESGTLLLEEQAGQSRSMAAIFARHEAWALIVMMLSHLLQVVIDVVAARLPIGAPARIAREMLTGVRVGVRPVTQTFGKGERAVK